MKALVSYSTSQFSVDFNLPINISLTISRGTGNPRAYFLPEAVFVPFRAEGFVGSVQEGGPCNCEILQLSPHGNGTHTECVGHISSHEVFIVDCLQSFHTIARLRTVTVETKGSDRVISCEAITRALDNFNGDCLVLRTLPNAEEKKFREWSGSNPVYCEPGVGTILRERGIKHFLLDLPSVDKESDGGALGVHHEFWNYPSEPRFDASITEMIYVPDHVQDAEYWLQFSIMGLQSDASPSQIHLYALQPV